MTDMTQNKISNPVNEKNMTYEKGAGDISKLLHQKIKETWPKLSDDDVKLYMQNQEQFFAKLKSTHHVEKMDAQTKISDMKKKLPESVANDKPQEPTKSTNNA